MNSYFIRLTYDHFTARLDELLDTAKIGTWKSKATLAEVRDALDRGRLLEVALRAVEGRPAAVGADVGSAAQDEIAQEAVRRAKGKLLCQIATLWPGDGLGIIEKESERPFEELTEGMRALAIKEISFAASDLPVATDQPEDAVPTQAVYASLVPTIRSQRRARQFVIVSHDANLVVAGDVERIIVLRPGDEPLAGSLFNPAISRAAMDLLEGGEDAFRERARRYRPR
jgi:hypothetical protein